MTKQHQKIILKPVTKKQGSLQTLYTKFIFKAQKSVIKIYLNNKFNPKN